MDFWKFLSDFRCDFILKLHKNINRTQKKHKASFVIITDPFRTRRMDLDLRIAENPHLGKFGPGQLLTIPKPTVESTSNTLKCTPNLPQT